MTKHYSEAELLETYYTQPGESMPVMMHLASCADCAARYERLERKLRSLAACDIEKKPETFWTRQRMLILRGIGKQHGEIRVRTWRVAAAAVLAFALGGTVVYKTVEPELKKQPAVTETHAEKIAPAEDPVAHDAWQSDELRDFHGMVEWETWDDNANAKARKGSSL